MSIVGDLSEVADAFEGATGTSYIANRNKAGYLARIAAATRDLVDAAPATHGLAPAAAGGFIPLLVNASAMTTTAATAGRLDAIPFRLPRAVTIDQIVARVTTGAVGNCRMGIYADDGAFSPGDLLVDSGDVSTADPGDVVGAVSLALAGRTWYWAAINSSATPTYRCVQGGGLLAAQTPDGSTNSTITALRQIIAFGALPDPMVPAAGVGLTFPLLRLRVAA